MTFAGTPSSIIRQYRAMLKPGYQQRTLETVVPKDGAQMPVDCAGCARCCRSAFLVKLRPEEAARLPHDVRDGAAYLQHRGRDCVMFDAETNRCSIYEDRPVSCRQYDCRPLWLAGLRNRQRGQEINERLEAWRTEVHSDVDLGVVAVVWLKARSLYAQEENPDVGLIAGAAVMAATLMSDAELASIGRKARRGGVADVIAVLNGVGVVVQEGKHAKP